MKYKVITAECANVLEDRVNEYLQTGNWEVTGGLAVLFEDGEFFYAQAIIWRYK